jgi:isocitrate/isopropylmalate dehydrogenase
MSKTYKIAVIPGDGTGPEVVDEGRKALIAAGRKFGFSLEMTDFDYGGERYLRTGEVLPDAAADELRQYDAIYLGAIGHPDVKPGILEKGILLRLRFELINTSTCVRCASTREWRHHSKTRDPSTSTMPSFVKTPAASTPEPAVYP